MSIVVPPVDLAPTLPSRIVTVRVTDLPEGGLIGEPGWIEFVLPGDLRVPGDDIIVRAGSVRLNLDASGEGRVRLPVHNSAAQGDGVGGEWYLLVQKSWTQQVDMIRVPAGTGNISLADINPIVEVTPAMGQWLLTNASVSVQEGALWGATVSTSGGIAHFDFTVPPGGVAWVRGDIPTGLDLNGLTDAGVYMTRGWTHANGLGNKPPAAGIGAATLEVVRVSATVALQRWTLLSVGGPGITFIRVMDGGAWTEWVRTDARAALDAAVVSGLDLNTQHVGVWRVDAPETLIGAPEGFEGGLVISYKAGTAVFQLVYEYRVPGRIWSRRGTTAGSFFDWKRTDNVDVDARLSAIEASIPDAPAVSSGFKSAPVALNTPSSAEPEAAGTGSVRWPVELGVPVKRMRVHVRNANMHRGALGEVYGTVDYSGIFIGAAQSGGNGNQFDGEPQQVMPAFSVEDGQPWVSPWINVDFSARETFLIALGYTATGTIARGRGGAYRTGDPAEAAVADYSGTYSVDSPFDAWIEVETPAQTPILAGIGDSNTVGTGTFFPVRDSWLSHYCRQAGALPYFMAQHGATSATWTDISLPRWNRYAGTAKPDAVVNFLGRNDIQTGVTLEEMQDRFVSVNAAARARLADRVYAATITPSDAIPSSDERHTLRLAYNDWLLTKPDGVVDTFDFSGVISLDGDTINPAWNADGLHWRTEGHEAIAAELLTRRPTPITLHQDQLAALV